ncbi:efflux RND transporter permease subunit [Pseudomonas sp. B2M1-30]|uniref:efflux RND transporter permease subunit n=1 Tax=Pseudomonas TaxID=286 RepID=UPI0021C73544|nr:MULTISPECIES: efflux RND transporter permease subunit [Pseudomonas]MCU0120726.1 efflux RND transporter permease subunit [Pseudomonas sp. B2M1-30]MCU7262966.1 efflux RND transporter permease subunit [Pseudomonas koreensis]
MNVSRPFIERPVATTLLMVAVLLLGLLGYHLLSVSALPEVDYPTIQVFTQYPGASPEVISSSITAPLERQLGEMPGLKSMNSTSSDGASVVTLQFDLSLSLDVAEQEVQAAINAAGTFLPANLPYPPVYSKVNPADAPVLTLSLTSDVLPLTKVEDLADTRLAQKISQITGVGLVTLSGGQRPAVRVDANTSALNSLGLSLDDLRTSLGTANVNQAKGNIDGKYQAYSIGTNDQLQSAEEYRDLVIAYKNGAPIRLSQIASSTQGPENPRQAAWTDSTPSIVLNIQRQPGANVIDVVDRVQQLLPKLRASLPATLKVNVLTDRTQTIRASVTDVQYELAVAVLLVVIVIFLFLRNVAATIIPAVTVPLTLVGTLAVAYAVGFSLNNLTLMALTIAIGFVVDDAIVMIENITRYIEAGDSPMQAALKGAEQIGFTIISLSVALIAVMIPLLFMGDVVGRLFREFAMTVAVTIVISALITLTLTPMMCSRMLKHKHEERRVDFFDRVNGYYVKGLDWVLLHRGLTLISVVLTGLLTLLIIVVMPKGFFPEQDTGLIQGISQASPGISFQQMQVEQQRLAARILKDPAVASLSSFVGIDQTNPTINQGNLLINLKPHGERDSSAAVIRRLSDANADDAGIRLYLHSVQDLTLDATVSTTSYRLGLQATDPGELETWTNKLLAAIKQDPMFTDVQSQAMQFGNQIQLNFDRATASRLGITPQAIDDVLYDAFGQRQVSTIYTQLNQYHVVIATDHPPHNLADLLTGLYVAIPGGGVVPLSSMATLQVIRAPVTINRLGQFPYADVSFNLAPGQTLGAAVTRLKDIETQAGLPLSVQANLEGAAATFEASLSNQVFLVLAAIIVVYLMLGILYESFVHPVTILSTLLSAALGALLALLISGTQFDIIGLIGIVLLIGIVMKNGIMMVDFALELERKGGLDPVAAIRQAAELRFRPILMTSMASLFGAVPLALGTGIGSELRHPLGIAIIGGLLLSQLLTLFSTPVIFLAMHGLEQRFTRRRPAATEALRDEP